MFRTAAVRRTLLGGVALLAVAVGALAVAERRLHRPGRRRTTPIKHLVIIFGENQSFDHYLGTYPNATNPAGQPSVHHGAPGTPAVDKLHRQPGPA